MVEAFKKEVKFIPDLHEQMLLKLDKTLDSDAIGHFTNEHLKVSGAYWCIGSLKLLNRMNQERKKEIVHFIENCQHACGGFGGNIGHDPHITNTLYALLVLAMYDSVDKVNTAKIVEYVKSL